MRPFCVLWVKGRLKKHHIMKIKTIALTAATALFSLTACGGTNKDAAYNAVASGIDVEKTLKLSDFNGFIASWPVDIRYTQGQAYKVVARGSEETFNLTEISVIGGKLSIKRKKECRESDANIYAITLYVTAPAVNSIQNNSHMDFTTQSLKTDGLSIINNGVLMFKADEVAGKGSSAAFDVSNNGRMDVVVPSVKAGTMKIANSGVLMFGNGTVYSDLLKMTNHGRMDFTCNVKGGSVDSNNSGVSMMNGTFALDGDYKFTCYGRSDVAGDITARNITIYNSGVDMRKGRLKADNLSVEVSGRSDYDMSFAGGKAELACSGVGMFNLSLDCQSVTASASGRIEVTLSGTADNTEFTGSGVSHIKTSELNKF